MSDYQIPNPPALPRTSSLAVGSLICGILGIIVICLPFVLSLIGIILGHVAFVKVRRSAGQVGGEGLALGGLITGYTGIVLGVFYTVIMVAVLVPVFVQGTTLAARRGLDKANMTQIYASLRLYADAHKDKCPDDLSELAKEGVLPPGDVYVCPNTDTPAPETAAEIKAGRCDYVYLGKGLKLSEIDPKTVILYDKPGNFKNYINVGLAYGVVIGVKAKDIAEACAKKNWILPKPRK